MATLTRAQNVVYEKNFEKFPWTFAALLFASVMALGALTLGGCAQPIYRPLGAPVLLTNQTSTKDACIRQHGQWVKTSGTIVLYPGETVVLIPAATPTTAPTTAPAASKRLGRLSTTRPLRHSVIAPAPVDGPQYLAGFDQTNR